MRHPITAQNPGLAGDTLIHISKGIRRIDHCCTPFQHPEVSRIGTHPSVMIVTRTGKTITGSPHQTVLTINEKTGEAAVTPFSQLTKDHHLIGAAINPPNVLPTDEHTVITFPDECVFQESSYELQVAGMISYIEIIDEQPTLNHRRFRYSDIVLLTTSLGMMGCSFTHHNDYNYSRVVPLSEDSVLNKFLMRCTRSSSFYRQDLAESCCGLLPASPKLTKEILDRFLGHLISSSTILYSEQVLSMQERREAPLYSISTSLKGSVLANGFIVTGAAN